MDLQISATQDDGRDLTSLFRWLAEDASLRRHAQLSLDLPPATHGPGPVAPPGGMGGTVAVINAMLADASAIAGVGSLLIAYKTWRGTRSRPPAVTIRYGDVTVTVAEGSEQEIQPLLDALLPPPPDEQEDPGDR